MFKIPWIIILSCTYLVHKPPLKAKKQNKQKQPNRIWYIQQILTRLQNAMWSHFLIRVQYQTLSRVFI